jgi:arginyl-tRNA synthetase
LKTELLKLLTSALDSLRDTLALPADLDVSIQIERPREAGHGDFSSNLAMLLAKPAKRKPRDLAQVLVDALPASDAIDKVDIAGPGFINFFLKPAAIQAVTRQVLAEGDAYGHEEPGRRGRVMVEFVSANPTGPMHVGHGRGAAYGDSLSNLLDAAGWSVHREFYVNDAGRQVDILTVSVWVRYLEACGEAMPYPGRAYPGAYVIATAQRLLAEQGRRLHHTAATVLDGLPAEGAPADAVPESERAAAKARQERYIDALIERARQLLGDDYALIRDQALSDQLADIRATLDAFGVRFDQFYSERSVVESGSAATAIERLKAGGHVYELEGALWLRTSAFGDEKDRVLIKADGSATYFANDLAYHVDKLDRGFPLLLDVWGADHHGYIARVKAAIEALTGREDVLSVQLVQFVTLSSGRMGKRSGNFVTLQELISEAGKDATRFFYLLRSHEQHLEFNIDLARAQTNDNPVYYIQYAHARICSVLRQLEAKGFKWDQACGSDNLDLLVEAHELALLSTLSRFPEVIESAACAREPHHLAHYLTELANDFHVYYNAHTFLTEQDSLRNARINLCVATRQVIRNGLALLGVSAPEVM